MTSFPILCKHSDCWHTCRLYTQCKYSCIYTSEGPSINAHALHKGLLVWPVSRCFVNWKLCYGIATKQCFSSQVFEEFFVKIWGKGIKKQILTYGFYLCLWWSELHCGRKWCWNSIFWILFLFIRDLLDLLSAFHILPWVKWTFMELLLIRENSVFGSDIPENLSPSF